MARITLTLLVLLCAGCASQIMQRYVGGPLTAPMLDYGPPTTAFDIDAKTRAFVWTMNHSYTSPGYAYTSGNVSSTGTGTVMGNYLTTQSSGMFNSTTRFQPPQTSTWSCNYVLIAKRNAPVVTGASGWTVVSFKKPSLMCE